MTLINKILRVIPKKQVNINELERSKNNSVIAKTETVKKAGQVLNSNDAKPEFEEVKECVHEVFEIEIMPEKIICPDCGGLTLEGLEYCDKCGGDLTNL